MLGPLFFLSRQGTILESVIAAYVSPPGVVCSCLSVALTIQVCAPRTRWVPRLNSQSRRILRNAAIGTAAHLRRTVEEKGPGYITHRTYPASRTASMGAIHPRCGLAFLNIYKGARCYSTGHIGVATA